MRTGVSDQYSGESERVETNGGVAGAGPGSDVTNTSHIPKRSNRLARIISLCKRIK